MKTAIPLLADVRVASPCHSSWNTMKGDEQTRYCGLCRKNVYNLSEMTRQEAENLIREKEGKLCVRYYQRADGTVLTKDCPIGVAVVRRVLLARAVSASHLPPRWGRADRRGSPLSSRASSRATPPRHTRRLRARRAERDHARGDRGRALRSSARAAPNDRGARPHAHPGAVRRDATVRHRTAISQRILGSSRSRCICGCGQR